MKYAASKADGSIVVVDMAPEAIIIGGVEHPITFSERVGKDQYEVTYYDKEARRPTTARLPVRDTALKYHDYTRLLERSGEQFTEIIEVKDESTIEDRTFRNAWTIEYGAVTTDMVKAREIHREHMRTARKPKLEQADVEYFKALEASVITGLSPETTEYAALESTAATKQALRDVTAMPEIEAAQTPEELKAVWPDILK